MQPESMMAIGACLLLLAGSGLVLYELWVDDAEQRREHRKRLNRMRRTGR